jgi:hypothetical protein
VQLGEGKLSCREIVHANQDLGAGNISTSTPLTPILIFISLSNET